MTDLSAEQRAAADRAVVHDLLVFARVYGFAADAKIANFPQWIGNRLAELESARGIVDALRSVRDAAERDAAAARLERDALARDLTPLREALEATNRRNEQLEHENAALRIQLSAAQPANDAALLTTSGDADATD